MSLVFDSSSIVYLGKIGILDKMKFLSNDLYIPKNVYVEVVVEGFKRKEPEASVIQRLIEERVFIIKEGKSDIGADIKDFALLSEADREVISIAKENKSTAVIDEAYAKEVALSLGIKSHGTLYLIIELLEKKITTKQKTIKYLDKIIKWGFYLSIEKYREVLEVIRKL